MSIICDMYTIYFVGKNEVVSTSYSRHRWNKGKMTPFNWGGKDLLKEIMK